MHTPGILSPTPEQALDFFSKNWNAEVFADEIEERAAFSQGVAMIQDYYKKNDLAKINIIDLESRFQIEMGEKVTNISFRELSTGSTKPKMVMKLSTTKPPASFQARKKWTMIFSSRSIWRHFLKRYPKEIENLG